MNKNLKKVISAIAALALSTTSLVAVTASYSDVDATTPYNSAINQLSAMGIIAGFEDGTFKPDEAVTRAQFAKLVTGAQNKLAQAEANSTVIFNDVPAGHWAVGYVAQAKQDGLVDGTNEEGTTFDPEKNVTYAEAMKMLVCAAGYENWSENAGGWPNGFLQYAGNAGIGNGITGVSNDTALTRGQCAQMLANTLVAPICKVTGYEPDGGEQVPIRKQMDGTDGKNFESLLTNNWDMYEVNGSVTGTHESGATEAGKLNYKIMKTKNFDDSDIVLSLTDQAHELTGVYEDDAKAASATINQYTRAIISIDDADESKKIVYIESAGKNVEQEFDANNYSSLDLSSSPKKIKIFKSATSSTETEYKLSDSAKMLVNGVEINLDDTNATKYLKNNADVKAVLIDSPAMSNGSTDGKYDYVVVEYAATAVVDEVVAKGDTIKVIFDNYDLALGKANLEIDLNDDDKVYTFVKDGAEVEATSLVQNDVLSIVFDPKTDVNTSKFVKAVVVNNVVTGQCTATGTDTDGDTYYVVGGTNYYMSNACSDTLEMSYEYTLYLDINGEIAKVEQNAASVNYAIVDRFYTSAGDTMVRLITKTGEKSAYVLKAGGDQTSYDHDDDDTTAKVSLSSQMTINTSYTDATFPIEDRIVAYSINGSGEATLKNVDAVQQASVSRASGAYKASTQKVGSYKLTEGTIILNATAYADDATDAVTVIGLDYFYDEMDYVLVAAGKKNSSDNSYPFIVVVEGNDGYTVDTQMAVYESYGSTQVDGENKDQMYVYVNGENAEDAKGRTVVLAEDGVVSAANLTEGDVIVYKKNSDGYVDEIVKVTKVSTSEIANGNALAYANGVAKDVNSAMITSAVGAINFKGDGDVTFVFGPVINKTSGSVEIANVSTANGNWVSSETGVDFSYDVDTKFYAYDGDGRTGNFIEVGSAGSVLKSTVVNAAYYDNKTMINWSYVDNSINYVVARLLDNDVQEVLAIYSKTSAAVATPAPTATPTATPTADPATTEAPVNTEAPANTDAPDVEASGEVANEL